MSKFVALRPTLEDWAGKMEKRLRLKDKSHKHGWLDGKLQYYIVKIFECWREAVKAIQYPPSKLLTKQQPEGIKYPGDMTVKDIELSIKKCVDGANFFMMLADNLKNILKKKGEKKDGKL